MLISPWHVVDRHCKLHKQIFIILFTVLINQRRAFFALCKGRISILKNKNYRVMVDVF